MRHTESKHAQALFSWSKRQRGQLPGIELLVHVPNGGRRNRIEAARMKGEGVRKGFPDYLLPVPIGPFAGSVFELKTPGNYPTPEQRWWFAHLRRQSFLTFCAWDWLAASEFIRRYLQGQITPDMVTPGERPSKDIRFYGDRADLNLPTP